MEALIEIFQDIFLLEKVDEIESITQENIKDWDSIGHVRLISSIEEEFNIRILIEDAVGFNSLISIADYLIDTLN